MREIKFRAWAYGRPMMPDVTVWTDTAVIEVGEYSHDITNVEAIMQYTGLKDKNGVEIYEGDIVRCGHGNCRVEWGKWVSSNENSEDIVGWLVMGEYSAHPLDPQSTYWVIGNIYENRELLA